MPIQKSKRPSMKKILAALILIALVQAVSGCTRLKPGNQDAPVAPVPLADAPKEALSPRYHYLESRRHAGLGQPKQAVASLEKAIEKDPGSALLKRDLIRLYLELDQKDRALSLAEQLVEQDPENVNNLLLLARFRSGQDKEEAIDGDLTGLFEKILELDPSNKETYLRLGKIYMETKQYHEALDLFQRMANHFPNYYVAWFYLGEANMMTQQFEPAKQAFLKSIELEPDLVEARFRLIDIYRKVPARDQDPGSPDKILKAYETILDLEPGNLQAQMEMALIYFRTGQEELSRDMFHQLALESKTNSRVIMTAVDIFISQKRGQDAVLAFSQMLKADPESDNLNFFTAMAHESAGEFQAAVDHYLKVGPDHPQHKKAVLTVAFLYRDMGKTPEAVHFLEAQHAQFPRDIDIILYLSSFYEKQDLMDKAMALLENAVADSPENTSLLFRLGAIQDKKGLRQKCIETMKKIISIDADDASALNYLGYTYADMGIHLDQALDLVSRALKLKPEDGYITDSLGWVYFQKKEYEKAVVHLEKAAKLSNWETVIAAHLADAYVKAKRFKDALAAYEKALANADKKDEKTVQDLEKKIRQVRTRLEQ